MPFVEEAGLNNRFFEFLSIESPNNNIHNIRVCRMIVWRGEITAQQLKALDACDKVCARISPFRQPVPLYPAGAIKPRSHVQYRYRSCGK